MKVLITSDSHGLKDELILLKEQHKDVDYFIHCGDSELSFNDKAISGFHVVRGNCDFDSNFPNDLIVEAGSDRIFVTHGHLYSVKSTLSKLYYKALENHANIVCFGHSHILGFEMIEGILFINPSSLLMPRSRRERTYIILETTEKERLLHVFEFGGQEIMTESFPINQ